LGLKDYEQEDLDGTGVYYEIWNKVQLLGLGQKGRSKIENVKRRVSDFSKDYGLD
jgi:hypothetical protein